MCHPEGVLRIERTIFAAPPGHDLPSGGETLSGSRPEGKPGLRCIGFPEGLSIG